MKTGIRTAPFLVVLAGAVVGAVPGAPAGAAVSEASIAGYTFSPASLTIAVGDSVTWTNRDNDSHTVVANDGSFTSSSLTVQGTFTHVFSQAGTFAYHCAIHPSMQGTVQVGAATNAPAPPVETGEASGDEGSSLVVPAIAALVVLAGGAGWLTLRRR